MTRARTSCIPLLALTLAAACSDSPVASGGSQELRDAGGAAALDHRGSDGDDAREITMLDACDPRDPGWAPTGGCQLRHGDVSLLEFQSMTTTTRLLAGQRELVGHPAWRNQPSYLSIEDGANVRVTNGGGRLHTFTQVADFGGGRVPPLNGGLTPSPECFPPPGTTDPTELAPRGRAMLEDLPAGVHKFQCCFHPWMRAVIRVSD